LKRNGALAATTISPSKSRIACPSFRPEYAYAWKRLAVEIAKECIKTGWTDLPLRIRSFHSTRSTVARGIAEINPEIRAFEMIMKTNI
jgi:ribosomal protein S11